MNNLLMKSLLLKGIEPIILSYSLRMLNLAKVY